MNNQRYIKDIGFLGGMREFVYFSRHAPTAGHMVGDDLMKAGRMDIAIHTLIAAFFMSHATRTDTRVHLIFAGPPDPQKHLEITPDVEPHDGLERLELSKKNVAGLIKRLLFKCKPGVKREVLSGCFVEKKSINAVIDELVEAGKTIYVLDPKGEDIRTVEIGPEPVFILGDQDGIPKPDLKRMKKKFVPVSIGRRAYFASQCVVIVQNELDRREDARA